MFIFYLLFLAITGDGLRSQNSFIVATVRFSSEKLRHDDVEAALAKSANKVGQILCMVLTLRILNLFYASVLNIIISILSK